MVGKTNSISELGILIFGMTVGSVALMIGGLKSGIFVFSPEKMEQVGVSLTPATDLLNNFSCQKGERRQVFLGGVEDNYSTTNIEPTNASAFSATLAGKTVGRQGAMQFNREYDESGVDNVLIDEFSINGKVADGLLVIKSRSLVSFENDSFGMKIYYEDENGATKRVPSSGHSFYYAAFNQLKSVRLNDDIMSVNLSELEVVPVSKIAQPKIAKSVGTYLNNLNLRLEDRNVVITIGDDHQVDFLGLSLCFAPNENLGMTYIVKPLGTSDDWMHLSCSDENEFGECNPYIGETSCEKNLPLACFKDSFSPLPINMKPKYQPLWSGGHVKFTQAIQGDSFNNQDDVHAFCQAEFGPEWRSANLAEGASNDAFVAMGNPEGVKRAWVDSKTELYGNCWDLRPDYNELER